MRNEEIDESENYNENLIPTKAHVTRRKGDFIFIFQVNGYRGTDTGKLYYSRDEALRMEQTISTSIGQSGLESHFDIPQILPQYQVPSSVAISNYVPLFSGTTQLRENPPTRQNFFRDLGKVSQRIAKPKPSPKSS